MISPRVPYQRVRVNDISSDGAVAYVTDTTGKTIDVPLSMRTGKGGWPAIGEVWIITREYGGWAFAALLDSGQPPLINVVRDDADDLALQLLDALVTLGLVREDNPDMTYEDIDADADPSPSTADDFPDGDDPITTPDEDEVSQSILWLATFNTSGFTTGNGVMGKDLKRMLASPVQVLGLQEMFNGQSGPGSRDGIEAILTDQGWGVIRDDSGNEAKEWIWGCWRKKDIEYLDHEWTRLTAAVPGGGIARWALALKLRHLGSGRIFWVIITHFPPPARQASHYYTDQTTAVADLIDTYGAKHPVYVLISQNTDYRTTGERTHAGWPGVVFPAHDAHANWEILGQPSGLGTHGLPLIDYIYQGPDPDALGKFLDQRIMRGFSSQHRPVLVKARLKRKDSR